MQPSRLRRDVGRVRGQRLVHRRRKTTREVESDAVGEGPAGEPDTVADSTCERSPSTVYAFA